MKSLFKILTMILLLTAQSAWAEQYKILVPFAVGNQADITARSIAASIERNSKNTVTVINLPGAETIVATNEFVTLRTNFDIILLSASQVVWNPVLKSDLVRYSDSDFNYHTFVGSTYALWVTSSDSGLRTPEDLTKKLPTSVGGFATAYNMNLVALLKKYPQNSEIVQYKGTNNAIIDLMNGSLKLALVTPSQPLLEQVKAGKLHIIGTTAENDTVIDGMRIVSVNKKLGIQSVSGFMGFATHSEADPQKIKQIKNLLWEGITDPETQRILRSFYVQDNHTNDNKKIKELFKNQQGLAREFVRHN